MSVTVDGNSIKMTRGDTLRVRVNIEMDGEPYTPVQGDIVHFSMKRNLFVGTDYKEYKDESPLIEKNVPTDTLVLELASQDTKPLGFGTYAYNVELIQTDGTVTTFIESKIKLTEETDD